MTDLVSRCLGPYLRHRGLTSVDTVAVSHANYDHFSAVAEVVEAYGVREVLTSPRFGDHASQSAAAQSMLDSLAEAQRPPRLISAGHRIPLGRDTHLEVLWPPPDVAETAAANDTSLVMKLTHAGGSILFTGDIQDAAIAGLLRTPEQLKADVLVAPHHGSYEKLTARFLRAVGPAYVVSSNDRTLTAKQRAFDAIATPLPLLRTHRFGAVTVRIDESGTVTVETTVSPGPATRH
jgi:competence protein ComEC